MSYSIGDGIVTMALAVGIVGYVSAVQGTRKKNLEIIHEERMAAMEKGIPLPEFPMEPVQKKQSDPTVIPILGMVLFTLSLGAMVMLYLMLPESAHNSWIVPLPFSFLGVGFIGLHYMNGGSRR